MNIEGEIASGRTVCYLMMDEVRPIFWDQMGKIRKDMQKGLRGELREMKCMIDQLLEEDIIPSIQEEEVTIENVNDRFQTVMNETVKIFTDKDGNTRPDLCGQVAHCMGGVIGAMNVIKISGMTYNGEKVEQTENSVLTEKHKCKVENDPLERDYCDLRHKLAKGPCSECDKVMDLNYCRDDCHLCKRERSLMERADITVHTAIYKQRSKLGIVQKEREEREEREEDKSALNQRGNFKDRMLQITYTLADTDMTKDNRWELEKLLARNFLKLTKIEKLPCKGYLYVIEYTTSTVPHLHGLVRLTTFGQRPGPNDSRFHGKNRIMIDGKPMERTEEVLALQKPANVYRWIEYFEKDEIFGGNKVVEGNGGMKAIRKGW